MRGKKALFDDLFEDNTGGGNTAKQRARRDSRADKRNELLCARYLYHKKYTVGADTYEQIVDRLANEFFLTPIRIVRLLDENTELLLLYRQKDMSKTALLKRWPHWNW